jgi:DNA-binding Lrp family transcriptional regulator
MKDLELKLISELMKNSRRSDRELAKAIGISQPALNRMIKRLESEGYIKEYTIIPDFHKLGYEIMALTFFKLRKDVADAKEIDRIRKMGIEMSKGSSLEVVMTERGIGLGFSVVAISFHTDYTTYKDFRQWLNQFSFLEVDDVQSFLINLHDEITYRPLTFLTLANHLLKLKKKEKKG